MKYFEFGTGNEQTLLLLHGVDTTWQIISEQRSRLTITWTGTVVKRG